MTTYLLTWNPDRWEWPSEQLLAAVVATANGRRVRDRWSIGGRKHGVAVGERAMLLRQRRQRGVVASGTFVTEVYRDDHWDGSGRGTTYADVEWDVVVEPDDRLPVEVIKLRLPEVQWDRIQGSGVRVPTEAEGVLSELWSEHLGGLIFRSPEEVGPSLYREGDVTRIQVNRYERDPAARRACVERWGTACAVCGLDFESRYGVLGRGFIHVHHLKEISTVGPEYEVDAVKDLRPVCPNCHAMLHRERPALSISQLKRRLRPRGRRGSTG